MLRRCFEMLLEKFFHVLLCIISPIDWTKFDFNPFTPRSNHYLNYPYKFNTLSSRQVMRIKKLSTRGYCLDMTQNFQD